MRNRWHLFSFPMWTQLLLWFTVAIVIPIVLIFTLVVRGIREIDLNNAETAASQIATQQTQALASAFTRAGNEVTDYADSPTFRSLLLDLLPARPTDTLDPLNQARMIGNMQDSLLNSASNTFLRLDLLSDDGTLLVRALPGRTVQVTLGENLASSSAYRAATLAFTRGQRQTISVTTEDDRPVIEIVTVLFRFQTTTTGQLPSAYLVARLNPAVVVYDKLPAPTGPDQQRAFLVARNGVLIEAGRASDRAADLAASDLVRNALGGTPQTERLSDETTGTDLVRFAALVENTPFVLINERPANTVANQMLDYIATQGFPVVLGMTLLAVVLMLLLNQTLVPPLRRLAGAMQAVARGRYTDPIPDIHRADEIGELARTFADMRKEIATLMEGLSLSVMERERDNRAVQDIAHFAVSQRDLQHLIDRVVNLIVDRFSNIYHAQIFLIDPENRFAVLRASTGEAGAALLARGHRLEVGSRSVIGQVTGLGEVVVARDIGRSDIHRRNEFLPNTQAELAVPLRVGDRVIGALDVQSFQRDAFTTDQTRVLQIMADQIAIAIENARLYQQTLTRASEDERRQRALTRHVWREYLYDQRAAVLESKAGAPTGAADLETLRQTAATSGEPVVGAATPNRTIPIAVPIRLRGQTLGAVAWELPETGFDRNKVLLAQELTDRLAVSLDNARLFDRTQRAADRERLVNDIATRITGQTDIDYILRTAVREVGQALRAPQVSIHLNASTDSANNGSANGNGHSEAS